MKGKKKIIMIAGAAVVLAGFIAASVILMKGRNREEKKPQELTTAGKEETTGDRRKTTESKDHEEETEVMDVYGLGHLYYLDPDADRTFKERLTAFIRTAKIKARSARVLEDHEDDRDDEKEPALFYLKLDDEAGTIIQVSFEKTSGRYGFSVGGPDRPVDVSEEEGRMEHEIPESSEDEETEENAVSITDPDGDLGRAADMEELKAALTEYLRSIEEGRRNFIVTSVGVTEKGYDAVLSFETVRHDGRNVEVRYDGTYHFRLV